MAISELHTFPHISSVSLLSQFGPTQLEYNFTFRERTQSWYMDIRRLSGESLMLGRRISQSWMPTLGYGVLWELMRGVLYVIGSNGAYKQSDLGQSIKVWYIPESDLFFFNTNATTILDPTVTITSP